VVAVNNPRKKPGTEVQPMRLVCSFVLSALLVFPMELARVSSAVIRQQMGHATADMTALYTGEIPIEQVTRHFQLEPNGAAIAA
jgi:hypothetical protein